MRLEEPVERIAAQFLSIIAIGIIPLFTYTVLRGFIDALGKTRTTMIITLLSLPINVILNYLLIFGNFGFPKLGGVGAKNCFHCNILVHFNYYSHYYSDERAFCLFQHFQTIIPTFSFELDSILKTWRPYRICYLF